MVEDQTMPISRPCWTWPRRGACGWPRRCAVAGHIAAGHHDIAGLAAAASCDQDALHAVLGHLVAKGVFTEPSPGTLPSTACRRLADPVR